jgi:hypothetical protein
MADRSTGPVKPPVIDLTARTGARPDSETRSAANDTSERPASTRPPLDLREANWALLAAVGVGGAVLGTLLTYLLATVVPLPSHLPALPPDLTQAVSAQGDKLTTLTDAVGTLEDTTKKTQVSLDATITQLDGDMTTVNKQVADLKAAIPPAQPAVDLGPLNEQIKTLKAQVDAMAAGASGGDAAAIAQNISDLQTAVASVTSRLGGVDQTLTALRTDLDAERKALADHINAALPKEVGPAMKLPLLLSGLESAFATGRPFAGELSALAVVMPDLSVPPELKNAAATGLSRPDALDLKFEATLPEILAARDHSSGDWAQNAVDWAKSLLAVRPASEEAGSDPEAVVSRLEGAMNRHDYAAAKALLAQLPTPMQQAAAPVAPDIDAHAAADQLVVDLRSKGLAAAETTP